MCRWILGRLQGRDAPTADVEINECFAAILALPNPTPEMMPEQIRALRTDAVIATGRSDYPNQVNKMLCFPTSSEARWRSARRASIATWKWWPFAPAPIWRVRRQTSVPGTLIPSSFELRYPSEPS